MAMAAIAAAVAPSWSVATQEAAFPCQSLEFEDAPYVVCQFDAASVDIRLFLNDDAGNPLRDFRPIIDRLTKQNETLVFGMNAGMYHQDRSPVGYFVEKGEEKKRANTNDGPGNFHLKPNGIFFITEDGAVGVLETQAFLEADIAPAYATQSGPMLVVDGVLHPKFLKNSKSKKIRNGVGVTTQGDVVFIKSDRPVTFYQFASLFLGEFNTPNALFLDGTISRIYAPDIARNEYGVSMGPIIGVVTRTPETAPSAP